MRRRFLSMDLKFPALMTAIVLAVGALFAWAAYAAIGRVLTDTSSKRLRSSSALVSSMLADGVTSGRAALWALAREPAVRRLLVAREEDAVVRAALVPRLPGLADSTLLLARLVDRRGASRWEERFSPGPLAPGWVVGLASRDALSHREISLSPLLAAGEEAQYEVAVPVHARDDGESFVGHLVLTRVVRGRGVEAVRGLSGTATILVGQRDAGAWSDLARVVPSPPPIARLDTAIAFVDSLRGAGIGVAQALRGTPWVVWLEIPRREILAPARAFAWQMLRVAPLVALFGALITWLFSRRITNRIVRLTDEVEHQGGESPSPGRSVLESGRDELDRLEESYHVMVARTQRQHELEGQLLQAQKLEAVGRLAGGIAHDFNNVLTVVRNYGELVLTTLPDGSEGAQDMEQIMGATDRAARLTRQLLAFSRQQILQPVKLDLNAIILDARTMLARLLPTQVTIATDLDPEISSVFADPVQVEQVLINLALNASDAMPHGGALTFRTSMSGRAGTPGHVRLTVQDTGLGMDRTTLLRVFEPFFTTKAPGKGTGLGLASVHGIVTQLGGRISVESEPGRGTAFTLLLPASEGPADIREVTPTRSSPRRAQGRILLVEDDALTREVTRRILTLHGYEVVEVAEAAAAIGRLEREAATISLVVSDVMMPGMNGLEMADRIAQRWPALPVLLVSGYSDAEVRERAADGRHRALIEKPFTSASLVRAAERAMAGIRRSTPVQGFRVAES